MRIEGRGLVASLGDRRVLDGVDIGIDSGELVGLIGPNGAGKSTLLRMLAGLLQPNSGAVLYDGVQAGKLSPRDLARRRAYLAQDAEVNWPLSVARLTALGRTPYQGRWGAADGGEARAVADALRDTQTTELAERVFATLSGGERMRVLLARAFAVEADGLLADEPVAALDPYHQLQVMELLRARARRGAAVIAALHDLTLAGRFCDRLVLLHRGRVAAQGAPREVLSADNLARTYAIAALLGQEEGASSGVPWRRTAEKSDR